MNRHTVDFCNDSKLLITLVKYNLFLTEHKSLHISITGNNFLVFHQKLFTTPWKATKSLHILDRSGWCKQQTKQRWSAAVEWSREEAETELIRAISSSVSTDCAASASSRTGWRQMCQLPEPNQPHNINCWSFDHHNVVTSRSRHLFTILLATFAVWNCCKMMLISQLQVLRGDAPIEISQMLREWPKILIKTPAPGLQ